MLSRKCYLWIQPKSGHCLVDWKTMFGIETEGRELLFHELAQEVLAKAKETPEGEGNQPDEQVPEAEGQQEKAESEPTKEAKRESPIENESPDHLSENEASGELSSPGNLAGVATKKEIDP